MRPATRTGLSLAAVVLTLTACSKPEPGVVRIDEATRSVEFDAVVNAAGFSEGEMAGYHLIVYAEGGSADGALLLADVTDVAVLDALETLGATPGDALGLETWDERHDETSWKNQQVIAGPPIEILVHLPGREEPLGLDDFLLDEARVGFDMRFGGHRANIPAWHSGCVVCLYSCPGSKVGNASCTVRDFVEDLARFRVREGALPKDGSRVAVQLRLADVAAGS